MSDADIVTQALAYARAHIKHGPDYQEALAALARMEEEAKRLKSHVYENSHIANEFEAEVERLRTALERIASITTFDWSGRISAPEEIARHALEGSTSEARG